MRAYAPKKKGLRLFVEKKKKKLIKCSEIIRSFYHAYLYGVTVVRIDNYLLLGEVQARGRPPPLNLYNSIIIVSKKLEDRK